MVDRVKVATQVGIDDFVSPLPDRLLDHVEGLLRILAWPIPIAVFMEVSFEDRLEQQQQRHLHDSVLHCRDAQGARFTVALWYPDSEHRTGPITLGAQLRLQLIEEGAR